MAKTLAEKIADADERGSFHLAAFNELNEAGKGDSAKAQRHLERGQFWLDRSNKLRGNA